LYVFWGSGSHQAAIKNIWDMKTKKQVSSIKAPKKKTRKHNRKKTLPTQFAQTLDQVSKR
jgi:hypothetical protein